MAAVRFSEQYHTWSSPGFALRRASGSTMRKLRRRGQEAERCNENTSAVIAKVQRKTSLAARRPGPLDGDRSGHPSASGRDTHVAGARGR